MEVERESGNVVGNHSGIYDKAKQITKKITMFTLAIGFFVLLTLVLSTEVTPIEINLAYVDLSDFNNSSDVSKVPVSLNLSLTIIFSLTNGDQIDVKYDSMFCKLDYGHAVAKTMVPNGTLLAGHTELVNMTFNLTDPGFSEDNKNPSPIFLFAEIRRNVWDLFSMIRVDDSISCNMFVNVANRSITDQYCDNYWNNL